MNDQLKRRWSKRRQFQLEKRPCSRCDEMTFQVCYVGERVVCHDCFCRAVDKARIHRINADLQESIYQRQGILSH